MYGGFFANDFAHGGLRFFLSFFYGLHICMVCLFCLYCVVVCGSLCTDRQVIVELVDGLFCV